MDTMSLQNHSSMHHIVISYFSAPAENKLKPCPAFLSAPAEKKLKPCPSLLKQSKIRNSEHRAMLA